MDWWVCDLCNIIPGGVEGANGYNCVNASIACTDKAEGGKSKEDLVKVKKLGPKTTEIAKINNQAIKIYLWKRNWNG